MPTYQPASYRNLSPLIRLWEVELRRRGLSSRDRISATAYEKARRGARP